MANQSETIASLAAALAKAQGSIKAAIKDSNNPHFKSRYADLASVWEACRQPLSENGLSVIQTTDETDGTSVLLVTTLAHSSGEWIAGRLRINPVKSDPQGMGSAITYGRRYALAAIVGIAPDDDDGEAAQGRGQQGGQQQSGSNGGEKNGSEKNEVQRSGPERMPDPEEFDKGSKAIFARAAELWGKDYEPKLYKLLEEMGFPVDPDKGRVSLKKRSYPELLRIHGALKRGVA